MQTDKKKKSPKTKQATSDKKRPQPIKPDSQPFPLHTQNEAKFGHILNGQKDYIDSPQSLPSFVDNNHCITEPVMVNDSFTMQLNQLQTQDIPSVEPIESEAIVLNVYSKMKNLENKYIDLANLYKESLIEQTPTAPELFEAQFNQTKGRMKDQESKIIKDLLTEKIALEDNINSLNFIVTRALKSNNRVISQEQNQFKQLISVQQEVSSRIDTAQSQALHVLSQKQNDMFALATKSMVAPGFRNEALGLWYDAKSGVLQSIAELKSSIGPILHSFESSQANSPANSFSLMSFQKSGVEARQVLSSLTAEFKRFKKLCLEQTSLLENVQTRLKETENTLLQERQRTDQLVAEFASAIQNELAKKPALRPPSERMNQENALQRSMSPFQKRLMLYQDNSLQRANKTRPSSRGKPGSDFDMGSIKLAFEQLVLGYEAFTMTISQRHNFEVELQKAIEINQSEQGQFISQVDSILNYGNRTFVELKELISSPVSPITKNKVINNSYMSSEHQYNEQQLMQELKRSNEMYLDVRVENSRLRDQIVQLQHNSQQQLCDSSIKQRVQSSSKSKPKTPSNNMVNLDSDVSMISTQSVKQPTLREQTSKLCFQTTRFLDAMRRLQKAVNRKEKEVSEQKSEFENSKRDLETLLSKVKLSLQTVRDTSTGKSISQISQSTPKSSNNSSILKGLRQASANQETSINKKRMSSTKNLLQPNDRLTLSNTKKALGRSKVAEPQEDATTKLNQLLRQVKNLQLEKDKQTELIDELRRANSLHSGEREHFEERMKARTLQIHKFATQCQLHANRVASLEQTVSEYRLALSELAAAERIAQAAVVSKKAELVAKEETLKARLAEEQQRVVANTKVDPFVIAIREELTACINAKEKELEQGYKLLQTRLQEKEDDIHRVKQLFVDKLKELESSFVEISQEVVETDNLHQAARQKKLQKQEESISTTSLAEKQLHGILSKFDSEDREKEMENLASANQELIERNEELRKEIANLRSNSGAASNEMNNKDDLVLELNDQIEQLESANDLLRSQLATIEKNEKKISDQLENIHKDYANQETAYKKEIQTLKYESKRQSFDLKDSKERLEKTKAEYDVQFQALKATTLQMRKQMQKEYEQRVSFETKLAQATKQLKQTRAENASLESDITKLIKAIEEMKEEQRYLQEMRGIPVDDDDETETEDEQFIRKLTENPEEAAMYYRKLSDDTRKEFKLLQLQQKATRQESEVILNSITPELKVDHQKQTRLLACLTNKVRDLLYAKLEIAQAETAAAREEIETAKAVLQATKAEAQALRDEASIRTLEHSAALQAQSARVAELESQIAEEREAAMNQSLSSDNEFFRIEEDSDFNVQEFMQRQKALLVKIKQSNASRQAKMKSDLQAMEVRHLEILSGLQTRIEESVMERQEARNAEARANREKRLLMSLQSHVRERLMAKLQEIAQESQQKLDQADARYESLKAVYNALEREKSDLHEHLNMLDEQLGESKMELLGVKVQLDVKDTEIEQMQEVLATTEVALMKKSQELESLSQTLTIVQQSLKEESMAKSKKIALLEQQLVEAGMFERDREKSVTPLTGLDQSNILNVDQEEGDSVSPCEIELADNLNLTFPDPLEAMRLENERKQSMIDELITEINELKTMVDEAQDRITELTAKEEEKKSVNMPLQRNSSEPCSRGPGNVSRDSWGSNGLSIHAQIEEHLKHIRSIMIQFLTKLPYTTKENEDILPVLFSMLNFSSEQTDSIKKAREAINEKAKDQPKKAGGFFGLMKK